MPPAVPPAGPTRDGRCRHRIAERPQPAQRADAAHELHASAAAKTLGRLHGDRANAAGARDVRAAARRHVVAVDLDHAERSAAARLLAQRQRGGLGVGHEPDADRTVLPDDAVGFGLRRGNRLGGQVDGEVERGHDGAEVKADGAGLAEPVERRRQDVLPGVLLHVIEPARPVDRPVHAAPDRDLAVEHVPHLTLIRLDDVDDERLAERPGVARLTAGERVERRRVERDRGPTVQAGRPPSRARRSLPAARRCSRCDGSSEHLSAAATLGPRPATTDRRRPPRRSPSLGAGSCRSARTACPAGSGIVAAVRQARSRRPARALAG